MINSRYVWLWILSLALAGPAAADEVQLKNGSTLEGTVLEDGKKVTIDVGSGTITVDRSEVQSIHRLDEHLQNEYDRRLQAVKPDDANGYYQVYMWARQQPGMKARSESLLRKALEADPNFEPAHRAMGQINFKGAWLTPDEYKAALGLVRYQGQWVTVDNAERLRKIDQDLSLAAAKREADDERSREALQFERERSAQRQRFLDLLNSQVPVNVAGALGYPWAMRYWGPAQPLPPQPNAD